MSLEKPRYATVLFRFQNNTLLSCPLLKTPLPSLAVRAPGNTVGARGARSRADFVGSASSGIGSKKRAGIAKAAVVRGKRNAPPAPLFVLRGCHRRGYPTLGTFELEPNEFPFCSTLPSHVRPAAPSSANPSPVEPTEADGISLVLLLPASILRPQFPGFRIQRCYMR